MPKITKARIVVSPFSSTEMLAIGNAVADSVRKRIRSGVNANDQPSKPLKGTTRGNYVPYAEQKRRKGLQPIRDWMYSGRTLRSLKVLVANENRAQIGFTDAKTDQIAHRLNQIDRAFGMAPSDQAKLRGAVRTALTSGNVLQSQKVA